jgi:hypothetical protein
MREILAPVTAVQVQTELGLIYVTPLSRAGANVNAPHLTVDGMPLHAHAALVSDGRTFNFDLVQIYDSRTGRSSTAEHALHARLVDGRSADIVTLGKIAQVIVPAVRKFAEQNQALFLEAERRAMHNEVANLEHELENKRTKLEEKERALAEVTEALKRFR